MTRISRRKFVAAGGIAAAAPASGWSYFTAEEATLVEALCDRIVPADQDPGAREAKVVRYIDRQLAGPLKRFAATYRRQLPALEKACVERTGKSFPALSEEERTAFLEAVDRGEVRGLRSFFEMVVDHTMQGFYGDPKHGGNQDEASWKMLGIGRFMGSGHWGHR